jgi:hypothetical protein
VITQSVRGLPFRNLSTIISAAVPATMTNDVRVIRSLGWAGVA